ncbi:zinc finger protein 708-like [Littorina saxatilis]|uniref:zinc finger protein 708-like n=1 Tax=Littorina saxatilis TaxID=31220 RepID=UPI0038B4BCA0
MASASLCESQDQQVSSMQQTEDQSAVTHTPPEERSLNNRPTEMTDQKPYQCGLCSVTFDINVELVTHVHRHSLTKPYQCGYCKVSYEDNPRLIVHVKTHAKFTINMPSEAVRLANECSAKVCRYTDPRISAVVDSQETASNNGVYPAERQAVSVTNSIVNVIKSANSSASLTVGKSGSDEGDRTSNSTVVNIGSEMVLENPWQCENEIKSEVSSDEDGEGWNSCLDVKTESDNEDLNKGNQVEVVVTRRASLRSAKKSVRAKSMRKIKGNKNSTSKPFKCDLCAASFKVARYVADHKRRVHKVSVSRSYDKQENNNKEVGHLLLAASNRSEPDQLLNGVSGTMEGTVNRTGNSDVDKHSGVKASQRLSKADTKFSYDCSICGKVLANSQTLKRHKIYVHSDSRPFPCSQCSMRFKNRKHLKDHIAFVHNDERHFPCSHCPARLKTKVQLNNHIRNKHTHERPYQCSICSARFKQKGILTTHIKNRHSEDNIECKDPDDRPYLCRHCPAQFKLKGSLSTHTLLKHNDIEGANKGRPCVCPHCPLKFKQNCRLENHIARVHENRRPYPCPHCGTCFKGKGELSNHVKRIHNTETPHQCTDCGKCFKVKAALNQHWCRPRECPLCKTLLNCPSTYQTHMMRKHSKDRHQCSHCERDFGTRQELKVHIRTHTKEKPYTCEFCGQSFAVLTYLNYHRNGLHLNTRPYKCPICQKGFNSYSSMWQHKRRHLGDRRYPCTQCDKKFYNSDSLRRHALTHTEIRAYVCFVCEKTYRSRSSLKYHLKNSHQL